MEYKSDILITLFRFPQKVLSEITKPFHLRIWKNIVESCKRNVFNLGLESNSQSGYDLHRG